MKIMRPVALAALTVSLATPALADRQETIYLNPFAGFQLFDDKRDLSETGTFGVGVEYRFLPRWSVEALYSRANASRSMSTAPPILKSSGLTVPITLLARMPHGILTCLWVPATPNLVSANPSAIQRPVLSKKKPG